MLWPAPGEARGDAVVELSEELSFLDVFPFLDRHGNDLVDDVARNHHLETGRDIAGGVLEEWLPPPPGCLRCAMALAITA